MGVVYIGGVFAGSLASSIFDKSALLVGGSGGVYALLTAHAAHLFVVIYFLFYFLYLWDINVYSMGVFNLND